MNRNTIDSGAALARYASLTSASRSHGDANPALSLLLTVRAGVPLPAHTGAARPAPDMDTLTDAVFARPLSGVYRHCGGACLKSRSPTRYRFRTQSCYVSSATAPPLMKCAVP